MDETSETIGEILNGHTVQLWFTEGIWRCAVIDHGELHLGLGPNPEDAIADAMGQCDG